MKKPNGIYLLIILMLFVAGFNAYGTYLIYKDPLGDLAGLETGRLMIYTPLKSYTMMGGLLAILGFGFPVFTAMCLISRPTSLKWPKSMNIYDNYLWTYAFSLYSAYIYLSISALHVLFEEGHSLYPTIMLLCCMVMIIVLNNPENQKYFIKKSKRSKSTITE